MSSLVKRLAELERQERSRTAAEENGERAIMARMSTEELRALLSLLENQKGQPDYRPTAVELAAQARYGELRGQIARTR